MLSFIKHDSQVSASIPTAYFCPLNLDSQPTILRCTANLVYKSMPLARGTPNALSARFLVSDGVVPPAD